MLTRRFLLTSGAAGMTAWFSPVGFDAFPALAEDFPVAHTDAEWRKLLTPAQYAVLRQSATEPPFSSPLLNEHRRGIFSCAGCGHALFASETKFDSGTGWPSFWSPLADDAVGRTQDTTFGMIRTAVHCGRCGGHLGHLFHDGPKITGLRYCMNGVALTFNRAAA